MRSVEEEKWDEHRNHPKPSGAGFIMFPQIAWILQPMDPNTGKILQLLSAYRTCSVAKFSRLQSWSLNRSRTQPRITKLHHRIKHCQVTIDSSQRKIQILRRVILSNVMNEAESSNKTQKRRAACDQCHAAKVKCPGRVTPCERCAQNSLPCHYSFAARMGKPPGSKNQKTLERMQAAAQSRAAQNTGSNLQHESIHVQTPISNESGRPPIRQPIQPEENRDLSSPAREISEFSTMDMESILTNENTIGNALDLDFDISDSLNSASGMTPGVYNYPSNISTDAWNFSTMSGNGEPNFNFSDPEPEMGIQLGSYEISKEEAQALQSILLSKALENIQRTLRRLKARVELIAKEAQRRCSHGDRNREGWDFEKEEIENLMGLSQSLLQTSGMILPTNIFVLSDALKVSPSEPKTYIQSTDSGNNMTSYFCDTCGTTLFCQSSGFPTRKVIKEGILDKISEGKPAMESYADRRAEWVPHVEGAVQKNGAGVS
ncbi:hypothetical protein G7Y89_g1496 [Cudoniella acicularis]|uniref:Zn(2)-C6 fungal-type domain-containing protein n=1 Tax=Cudoniella acicularis TaxID=354080 RepID=A0A8H4WA87_9HELO|nr:hypothetical protein G7Y89_g1496 [Cudoniella acicularis]